MNVSEASESSEQSCRILGGINSSLKWCHQKSLKTLLDKCFHYLNVYTYLLFMVIGWKLRKNPFGELFFMPPSLLWRSWSRQSVWGLSLFSPVQNESSLCSAYLANPVKNCRHIFVLRRSSIRLPQEKGEEGGEKSFWVIYSERKQTKPGHRGRALTLL